MRHEVNSRPRVCKNGPIENKFMCRKVPSTPPVTPQPREHHKKGRGTSDSCGTIGRNSGQLLTYAHLIVRAPNHIHNTVEANQAMVST